MRHYDFDEDEDNDDVEKFFEEGRNDDEEPDPVYAPFFDEEEGYLDTDIEMMHIALRMCEKSWFWRFRSLKAKLTLVATTYATLKRIM